MSTIYIGIDPGLHGGIVAIDTNRTCVFSWAADEKGRGDRVPGYLVGDFDARSLLSELQVLGDAHTIAGVAIESPLAFAKGGVSNALATGKAWGQLRATVALWGVPVDVVTPAVWSVAVLGKPPKGGWDGAKKQAAIDLCRAKIPTLALVLPGCRTPHDGLADAGCMALWLRGAA